MSPLTPPLGWLEVRALRKEMRRLDAVSPATARPKDELPGFVQENLPLFVAVGVIRASLPDTYYLSEPSVSTVVRLHVLKVVTFWFLVIVIPILILELSNARSSSP